MARKLIAGLGNPPSAFYQSRHNPDFELLKRQQAAGRFQDTAETLHNAGFAVLNAMAGARLAFVPELVCNLAEIVRADHVVTLVQPMNGMNTSGVFVKRVLDHLGLGAADLLLVYDDISMPLRKLRFRSEGSSGGHRGVQSAIEQIGSLFDRLKIGVGRAPKDVTVIDFVLSTVPAEIKPEYQWAIAEAAEACFAWIDRQAHAPTRASLGES